MRVPEFLRDFPTGFVKMVTFWSLVATMCFVLVAGVIIPESYRLRQVRSRRGEMDDLCARIEQRNQYLSEGLARLERKDPAVWDRVIRERLHWVRADEEPAAR
jgi:hypothetical protein